MNYESLIIALLSVEIAGVFALEIVAARRRSARKSYRALQVVEDEDGRTRVFDRSGLVEEERFVHEPGRRAADQRAEPIDIVSVPVARS